ncbi:hypothetical protein A1O3_04517 [Capronia epimyces CBS 606.96]|uniref:Uncharacterized protein n=1 Tax=Capronia epimyces CBS 606.96 TaxID=1182542 RepID=W9Y412_9EURO|nr:uncharacterized protein A1O3_04517 [Capronia epimyces CBS 606.96]EXJ87557.1 hypothetical protein A1O3_04517 [Capronia epimyces CBS 606.96]
MSGLLHGYVWRTFRYNDFEAERSDIQASSSHQVSPDHSGRVLDKGLEDDDKGADSDPETDVFQGINLTLTENVMEQYQMCCDIMNSEPSSSVQNIRSSTITRCVRHGIEGLF